MAVVDKPPRTPAERGQAITIVAVSCAAASLGGFALLLTASQPAFTLPPSPAVASASLLASHTPDISLFTHALPPDLRRGEVRERPAAVSGAEKPELVDPARETIPQPAVDPFATLFTTISPPPTPGDMVAPAVRAEIVEAHARWFDAYTKGDPAALARIEADSFRLVDMRPLPDRVSLAGGLRASLERVSVDVSGDALVLSARLVEEVTLDSGHRTVLSDLSEVWVPSGTTWRLLGAVIRPSAR